MNEQLTEILTKTTVDTLEQMAFLFSYTADDEDPPAASDVIIGGVDFSGPFNGSLHLKMTPDVLGELTVNMLGMEDDEEPTPEDRNDAFCEAINVVCGNLLPLIGGKEAVFDITSPQVFKNEKEAQSAGKGNLSARTLLEVEEGACEAILFIKGELPQMPE